VLAEKVARIERFKIAGSEKARRFFLCQQWQERETVGNALRGVPKPRPVVAARGRETGDGSQRANDNLQTAILNLQSHASPAYSSGKNCPPIVWPAGIGGTPSRSGLSLSLLTPSRKTLITAARRGRANRVYLVE